MNESQPSSSNGSDLNIDESNNINNNDTKNNNNNNDNNNNNNNNRNNKKQFICGVVEGFYGKPWTFCQRKDLFKRLKEFNMNSFMYAPKDDTKHRAMWRQLYNEEEANELRTLIDEATANGIDFYYSLAPGLDMIYSSQEEQDLLCRKFSQIKSLGCKSYAILFDDIEPHLTNEEDRVIFKDNYASAQVSITNLIYDFLDRPKFLFCPTEYCESRAVPTVPSSIYLNTIGTGLHNDIDIMWSGPRVVSRFITEESIKQLNGVLRRPAVIWENLHANDYDKKRVYLGPYSGRSTKIIPHLRGVLTNPNCEYEANYVAIHTLAQWSKCTKDINPLNRCNQGRLPLRQDAVRQLEGNYHVDELKQSATDDIESVYDPDRALVRAIRDWLPHFLSHTTLPHECDISTMNHRRSDQTANEQLMKDEHKLTNSQDEVQEQQQAVELFETDANGGSKPIEEADMPDERSPAESTTSKTTDIDMSSSPNPLTPKTNNDSNSSDLCDMPDASENSPIEVGCAMCGSNSGDSGKDPLDKEPSKASPSHKLDINSLALVTDFFFLPFEHGFRGYALLNDINWLIENSFIFEPLDDEDEDQREASGEGSKADENLMDDDVASRQPSHRGDSKLVELWAERAEKLNNFCTCIQRVLETLIHDCPNKLIMTELYPYLMELCNVIIMLMDYIKFLRHRKSSLSRFYFSNGPKRKELTSGDEQEPWAHRGGLIGDVQRLILTEQ